MWNSPTGVRTLTPSERELVICGLIELYCCIEHYIEVSDEGDTTSKVGMELPYVGIEEFDNLTRPQKIMILAEVTEAMLGDGPPLENNSARDSAVAAIFCVLEDMVREQHVEDAICSDPAENDEETVWSTISERLGQTDIKQLVLTACHPKPIQLQDEVDFWIEKITDVCSQIVRMEYLFLGEKFLDLPPQEATEAMQQTGIPRHYYMHIVPEPSTEMLCEARKTIQKMTGLIWDGHQ